MKQAIMPSSGIILIRDVQPPTIGNDEVLLRVIRIGVCGSDVHVYHGQHPSSTPPGEIGSSSLLPACPMPMEPWSNR